MSPGHCFCHNDFMSDRWVEAWLSAPRFQRYLKISSGDRERALALYEWNVETSQVLMHDIAHFEVALRNVYDAVISDNWPHKTHWPLHPQSPVVMPIWRNTAGSQGIKRHTDVNIQTRNKVKTAIKRSGSHQASPGKVIAELSFGFWRHLTTKAMEKPMWVPYLHEAFPSGTDRADIDKDIKIVNDLRNRIAHHESLLTGALDPAEAHKSLMHCLELIAPQVHAYVAAKSKVETALKAKP